MIPLLSSRPMRKKRVLVRVDFNVPIVRGRLGSDFRIRVHLPTLARLMKFGNGLVLLSHHSDRGQTLAPVAGALSRILGARVRFLKDLPLEIPEGRSVYLLENLRFWPGEEREEMKFARSLARLGDCFVNDAFSAAHRRGASLTVLPRLLPSFLGLLFERELGLLDGVLLRPRRPLAAVLGGAKLDTKLPLLKRFAALADRVLVGGVLADEFVRAQKGKDPRGLSRLAVSRKLSVPSDGVYEENGRKVIFSGDKMFSGKNRMLDIGPRSVENFLSVLARARTIVWNGPMGFVEDKRFSDGTRMLARALSENKRAQVIVGGGDTIAFLEHAKLLRKFKSVSAGGGAMLAYLAGEKLPALEALRAASKAAKKTSKARRTL